MTVKELICKLLEYPMDVNIDVCIIKQNNDIDSINCCSHYCINLPKCITEKDNTLFEIILE